MKLDQQIASARKRVHRDGYDMSFGELASMYERHELVINPEYQRLFRWHPEKKTAFIESLLLGIPIPPIFIFTRQDGVWELIDGLQRVSTVFELMGILKDEEDLLKPRSVLGPSELLPDLEGRFWPAAGEGNNARALSQPQQIALRRSRLRIEILDQQTDPEVKFELFQRLNTGGTNLSEQEVRNCIIASLDSEVYRTLIEMADFGPFKNITDVGSERERRQYRLELIIRFIVLRNFPYTSDVDVHRYLDRGMIALLTDADFDWAMERKIFEKSMTLLEQAAGVEAFRTNKRFSLGKYEFASLGVSRLIENDQIPATAVIKAKLEQINSRIDRMGNLSHEMLMQIVQFLGLPATTYEAYKGLIDDALLFHRNKIAHGEYLDVDAPRYKSLHRDVVALVEQFKDDIENAATMKSYKRAA